MNLTDISIKNPVFAWMLMGTTVLFGLVAISRVGISQYPDVDYPNISVSLSWPGASPSAVEREIIEPLEQAIAQVEGVKQISSNARQGSARVTAMFDISRNVDLGVVQKKDENGNKLERQSFYFNGYSRFPAPTMRWENEGLGSVLGLNRCVMCHPSGLRGIYPQAGSVAAEEQATLKYIQRKLDSTLAMDFVHVTDAARALLLCARNERCVDGVINVGSGQPTKLVDCAHLIGSRLDRPVNVVVDEQPGYQTRYLDITLANALLGWRPEVGLSDGISDLVSRLS